MLAGRSFHAVTVVAVALVTAPAAAERSAAGFELTQTTTNITLPGYRPIWADSQERVVTRSGPVGKVGCIRSDGTLKNFDPNDSQTAIANIAARRGQDDFLWIDFHPSTPPAKVYRVSCTTTSVLVATHTFSAALTPQLTSHPWLISADGSVVYPAADGIGRLTLTPAPTASAVVTKAELAAALGIVGAPSTFGIYALAEFPDGRLVFIVQQGTAGETLTWLVERSLTGVLTARWFDRRMTTVQLADPNLIYDPAIDAMLFDRAPMPVGPSVTYTTLGVLPRTGAPNLFQVPLAWPVFPFTVVGGSASLFTYDPARNMNEIQLVSRLTYVPAMADFDRDGLRADREALLGTSDHRADSDGDGVTDRAEATFFATDPTSAVSTVPAASLRDDIVLGPSTFSRYLPLGPEDCRPISQLSPGRVQCKCLVGGGLGACMGPDLIDIPNITAGVLTLFPHASATTPSVAFNLNSTLGWDLITLATGAVQPLPQPFASSNGSAVPISATQMVVLEFNGEAQRLWRIDLAGTAFPVVDRTRLACPIVANAADLARCGDADLFSAPPEHFDLVGFEPQRQLALVHLRTEQGRTLLGIGASTVEVLADLTYASDGFDVRSVLSLGHAGSKGYMIAFQGSRNSGGNGPSVLLGMTHLDEGFTETALPKPFLSSAGAGTFFKRGFVERRYVNYLIEPAPSGCGCMASPGIFVCDSCPARLPMFIPLGGFVSEWIPVAPPIEKGEVLFWTGGRYTGISGGVRNPHTGDYVTSYGVGWILWRITPVGAVTEWLEEPTFVARLSPADRALLTATPLGAITAMGVSPDGLAICLAESAASRVWELTLDPATRVLSSIRLSSTVAAAGCAYDDAGRLAVVGGSPVAIHVTGGGTHTVAGVTSPSGLHRFGASWIVQAHAESSRCVDDAGIARNSNVRVVSISSAPGGLAYVDTDGFGHLTNAERFCAAMPPLERMTAFGYNIWSALHNAQTFRSTNAVRGVMAMRPDGVAFLSASDLAVGGIANNPQTVVKALFHLFPQLSYVDYTTRMPELDAFRLVRSVYGLAHLKAANAEAMTIVPGAPVDRDWGYTKRPGDPFTVEPPGGEPPMDGGTLPPGPDSGGGCCGTTRFSTSVPGLLVLVLLLVRRRRVSP